MRCTRAIIGHRHTRTRQISLAENAEKYPQITQIRRIRAREDSLKTAAGTKDRELKQACLHDLQFPTPPMLRISRHRFTRLWWGRRASPATSGHERERMSLTEHAEKKEIRKDYSARGLPADGGRTSRIYKMKVSYPKAQNPQRSGGSRRGSGESGEGVEKAQKQACLVLRFGNCLAGFERFL